MAVPPQTSNPTGATGFLQPTESVLLPSVLAVAPLLLSEYYPMVSNPYGVLGELLFTVKDHYWTTTWQAGGPNFINQLLTHNPEGGE